MTENPRLTFEQLYAYYKNLNDNYKPVKPLESTAIDTQKNLIELFSDRTLGNETKIREIDEKVSQLDNEFSYFNSSLGIYGNRLDSINGTVIDQNQTIIMIGHVVNEGANTTAFLVRDLDTLNNSTQNLDSRVNKIESGLDDANKNKTLVPSNAAPFIEINYEEVSAECLAQVEDPETKICELVQKANTQYTTPENSDYVFAYKNIDGNFVQEAVVQRCETFSVTRTEIGEEDAYGEITQTDTIHTYNLMMSGDVCMIGDHTEQLQSN